MLEFRYRCDLTGIIPCRLGLSGLLGAVLISALISVLGSPVRASETGAPPPESDDIEASAEYLEYSADERIAVLKGEAHVAHEDLRLWAQNIHADLAHHDIHASGAIEVWHVGERLRGEHLSYNYRTRRGTLSGAFTKSGPNFVWIDSAELEPLEIRGRDVITTTCDRDPPHYSIRAREMVLRPGESLVLKNVRFVVGGKTWFKLHRYVINLRNGEAVDRFFLSPGYSKARGFNLRTAYQFVVEDRAVGRAYYNPSQFEGTDLGLDLNYKLDDRNRGSFRTEILQSRLIGQSSRRYTLSHHAALPLAQTSFTALVTKNTFSGQGSDDELTLQMDMVRPHTEWTYGLSTRRRFDLDGDRFTGDAVEFLGTNPRFTFRQNHPHSVFGSPLQLTLDGDVAQIREDTARGSLQDHRLELNVNLIPPPLRVGRTQTIGASLRNTTDLYGQGDLRNFLSFQASSSGSYDRGLATAFNYVFQDSVGTSPFRSFDVLPPRTNLMTGFLRFRPRPHLNSTLFQVTYDFDDNLFSRASSSFVLSKRLEDGRNLSLALTPVYFLGDNPRNLGGIGLDSVAANLRLARKDRWSHNFITSYDARRGQFRSFTNRSSFPLGTKTHLDLDLNVARGQPFSGLEITRLDIGLTRDLHMWESRLRWNVEQKEVFLEFYLKFASSKRVGVGLDYEGDTSLKPTFGRRAQVGGSTAGL